MRKEFSLVLSVILLLSIMSEAQAITFGFKAGYNFADLIVKPINPGRPQLKNIQTFSGGFYLAVGFGPFSIQPEFLYTRRGTSFEAYDDSIKYQAEYQLDYLEGVLLLKWKPLTMGSIKALVLAGPSFGYLSKARLFVRDESGVEVGSADSKDYFKSSELAAVFGAGVEFKLPVLRITVEGRYHLGLSNIARVEMPNMEVESIKNKGYTVMLSLGF